MGGLEVNVCVCDIEALPWPTSTMDHVHGVPQLRAVGRTVAGALNFDADRLKMAAVTTPKCKPLAHLLRLSRLVGCMQELRARFP